MGSNDKTMIKWLSKLDKNFHNIDLKHLMTDSFMLVAFRMENIKHFLNTSSINGVNHINDSRKVTRLFWIFVVFAGFIASGILINQSFNAWKQSPISTTTESVPIADIKFPKVTVCPPKNTYTNLNYDLMKIQNLKLDNETRNVLSDFAVELLNDHMFDEMMTKLNKIQKHSVISTTSTFFSRFSGEWVKNG